VFAGIAANSDSESFVCCSCSGSQSAESTPGSAARDGRSAGVLC
jgi:hypothetical protein